LIAGSSAKVQAQTQTQLDRLDELAQFTAVSPMCKKLGFTIAPDIEDRLDPVVQAEIATWDGDHKRLETAAAEAMQRRTRMLAIDLKFFADGTTSEAKLRDVKSILIRYGHTCEQAALDKVFQTLVSVPVGYNLEQAATIESDGLLEAGGFASWQTPQIAARGDMMTIAGACRHLIGPHRSDALRQMYGRSDDPRERAYYNRSFDSGLSDTELNMDRTQCERAISRYRQKISVIR
jgi:hypothetical protein